MSLSRDLHRSRRSLPGRRACDTPVAAIHAAVPGRLRMSVRGLRRSSGLKLLLEARVAEEPWVRAATADIWTGNMLVLFDPGCSLSTAVRRIRVIVAAVRRDSSTSPSFRTGGDPNGEAVAPIRRTLHRLSEASRQPLVPRDESPSWHTAPTEAALAFFASDRDKGLSAEEARRRLQQHGANVLGRIPPRSPLAILLQQFNSLPIMLLGGSAVISLLTGGIVDAAAILAVVGVNAFIGYMTESQAERTIQGLMQPIQGHIQIVRDGKPLWTAMADVVPGDVLMLAPGMFVAADGRIIEADDLTIDESSLTGEFLPIEKTPGRLDLDIVPLGSRRNMVYKGTIVTGGSGRCVVTATGSATEIGKIQTLVDAAKTPETRMQRQLDQLGRQLGLLSLGVCGAVFAIGVLRGYSALQMLKGSIALAVAAVPEGLPAMATTTLALGIRDMQK